MEKLDYRRSAMSELFNRETIGRQEVCRLFAIKSEELDLRICGGHFPAPIHHDGMEAWKMPFLRNWYRAGQPRRRADGVVTRDRDITIEQHSGGSLI